MSLCKVLLFWAIWKVLDTHWVILYYTSKLWTSNYRCTQNMIIYFFSSQSVERFLSILKISYLTCLNYAAMVCNIILSGFKYWVCLCQKAIRPLLQTKVYSQDFLQCMSTVNPPKPIFRHLNVTAVFWKWGTHGGSFAAIGFEILFFLIPVFSHSF